MQNWRTREDRKTVRIGVRVRTDTGWIDATVHNVSSHGLMLHSLRPLSRNDYIEIARGAHRIVGRVVWSQGAGCGLRAQGRIDIAGLLAKPGEPAATPERLKTSRVAAQPMPKRSIEEQARASRAFGQSFERMIALIVGASVSMFAASTAYEALAAPFHEVGVALGAARR